MTILRQKFAPKFDQRKMVRRRAKKLTDDEKAKIIEAYRKGVKPATIALVLNKSPGQIHNFHSRWKLNSTLPPKDIIKSTICTGRIGLKIKDLALNNPKLSSRKLARMLKDALPNQSKYYWL